MADPKHLEILRQGVATWNRWREDKTIVSPDLERADLSDTNFKVVNQSGLSGADLSGANIRFANLSGTDLRHAGLSGADLARANLRQAKLDGAEFVQASLIEADLSHANLIGANFYGANLSHANLTGADLGHVNLDRTNLSDANLSDTTLSNTRLNRATFSRAKLKGAHIDHAEIGQTVIADTDLSEIMGLETVTHHGPSTIGLDTFFRSQGKIPESFLRGAGVPDIFLEYATSLVGKAVEFYSAFISYSSKDEDFAKRLYASLQANGVRCWLFPEDAKWGETAWGEIDRGIKVHDKLVLICSEHSLQSEPVLREIERALQREDKEKKSILFPLRIDNYIFEKWEHHRKADVVRKVVGDMRDWTNPDSYKRAFERLLRDLKSEKPAK